MGTTAVHRALEGAVDGTWIIDKRRRRMNGRKGYITTKITQREKKRKKAQRKERGS